MYRLHAGAETTPDPMRSLVYRVHPIPLTLQACVLCLCDLA